MGSIAMGAGIAVPPAPTFAARLPSLQECNPRVSFLSGSHLQNALDPLHKESPP
jgi:hypothetical protein